MSILSGYIKQRKYKKTTEGYKLVSEDTQSTTTFMSNGITLEDLANKLIYVKSFDPETGELETTSYKKL